MSLTTLDTGRVILSNAKYVNFTPYTDEDNIGDVTYDIASIVGDTLSFTPDDNTVTSKESEFKDDPLFETVTLGKYQFAATCIDFQNDIMTNIFGWESTATGVYAPVAYTSKYAAIEVGFHDGSFVVVAPKVKLNSKATLASLKTSTGECNLAGTAYSSEVNSKPCPIAFVKTTGVDTTYTIKSGSSSKTFKPGNSSSSGVQS
jgi:hypothetical protein